LVDLDARVSVMDVELDRGRMHQRVRVDDLREPATEPVARR